MLLPTHPHELRLGWPYLLLVDGRQVHVIYTGEFGGSFRFSGDDPIGRWVVSSDDLPRVVYQWPGLEQPDWFARMLPALDDLD
jgi:hypothetical protein